MGYDFEWLIRKTVAGCVVLRVKIGSETGPVSFEDPDEAKNFIEKKFREFEGDDREMLEVEVRK